MNVKWKKTEDYGADRPSELDVKSSPTTVYLNRNIRRCTKENDDGSETEYWVCDRLQLSLEEYEIFKNQENAFLSPIFQEFLDVMNEYGLILAETRLNTEYSVCLQELSLN